MAPKLNLYIIRKLQTCNVYTKDKKVFNLNERLFKYLRLGIKNIP